MASGTSIKDLLDMPILRFRDIVTAIKTVLDERNKARKESGQR